MNLRRLGSHERFEAVLAGEALPAPEIDDGAEIVARVVEPHSPAACRAGRCAHAVSERNPCGCPDCDALTATMVRGYADGAAMANVETRSQSTPRFAERTFGRFIVTDSNSRAYEAARAVAADPARGLGIHGDVGLGKSHLAAAIANACMGDGVAARYVGVEELLSTIRATYDGKGGGEHALVRSYATVPVLVLDDMGKEALSEWSVRTLFSIINRRYEQSLPLVVTSNFSPGALAGRHVGAGAEQVTYTSTMDRVGEMAGAWVEIRGASRR